MTREFLYEEIDDEIVAIDLANGEYWGLNQTGAFIWKLLKNGKTEIEITAHLAEKFNDNPESIELIVHDFIENLKNEGFIETINQ